MSQAAPDNAGVFNLPRGEKGERRKREGGVSEGREGWRMMGRGEMVDGMRCVRVEGKGMRGKKTDEVWNEGREGERRRKD